MKNVIFVIPIWWFGAMSLYSGTQIYDVILYNSYNLFFTGMPICWYATFDYQHTKEKLLSDSSLYKIGLTDKCFNPFIFWYQYLISILQGGVLLFITYTTLDESAGNQIDLNFVRN